VRLTACALVFCLFSAPASAGVVARIDNATQRMTVSVNGAPAYSWPVSTARKGYRTPAGSYRVQRMARMWYSRKYNMSPMPHSLFFRGGYAIHGTNAVGRLGRPASHGCVRLSPGSASRLYSLVQQHGGARIVVTNGGRAAYANLRSARPRTAHLRSHRAARLQRAAVRRSVYPVRTYSADPWSAPAYYGGYGHPFGSWY
jgi:hypothetical protein